MQYCRNEELTRFGRFSGEWSRRVFTALTTKICQGITSLPQLMPPQPSPLPIAVAVAVAVADMVFLLLAFHLREPKRRPPYEYAPLPGRRTTSRDRSIHPEGLRIE